MATYHFNFRQVILDRGVEHHDYLLAIQDWEDDLLIVSSDELQFLDEAGAKALYDVDEFVPIVMYGSQPYGHCVCTKEIIWHYRIRNIKNNYKMFIGSDCFEHINKAHLIVSLKQASIDMMCLIRMISKPNEFHFKLPSSHTIEYCALNNIITSDEFTFCDNFTNGYKRNDCLKLNVIQVERIVDIYLKMFRRLSRNPLIHNADFNQIISNIVLNNTNIKLIEEWYRKYHENPSEDYLKFHFDSEMKVGLFYPNFNGYLNRYWWTLTKINRHHDRYIYRLNWSNTYNPNGKQHIWKNDTKYCATYECSNCGKFQMYNMTEYAVSKMVQPLCRKCVPQQTPSPTTPPVVFPCSSSTTGAQQ